MKKDNKRGFQGGIFVFLIAAILIILAIHGLTDSKSAKVSFSHQLEHLVNLDLTKEDHNTKTSLNDNLVTFSGKFKQQLSDDATARFRYLELLDKNHELGSEKIRLLGELSVLKQRVVDSAAYFLKLSGIKLGESGYQVISPAYNNSEFDASVRITKLSGNKVTSMSDIEGLFNKASNQPSEANLEELSAQLQGIIQGFLSPTLGIGSESIKTTLRNLEAQITAKKTLSLESVQRLGVYRATMVDLQHVVSEIAQPTDGVRLSQLRSMRSYMGDLQQFEVIAQDFETNEAQLTKARAKVADVIWFFNNKELTTKALERQDPEVFEQWFSQAQKEWSNFEGNKGLTFKAPDQPRNQVLEKKFKSQEQSPNYISYILFTILPIASVVLLLYFIFSRQMKGGASSAMNFGKSPAKMLIKSSLQVTFKDVAGVDEAKEELEEIVDFLKDPSRFTALGARIPRGVLCVGPPGTGKTLIAKAVAGEADRPFFSISGSDFVEMFVGVGASRIRDLFEQAKKHAPCIVFIDEIDAVGRHRGAGIGGGHDEREQTLNQLLVEMDGMNSNEGVILMAATNRPDVLDKALLRPGRFDRRIVLDLPDVKGRYEILKVHAKKIKLDSNVDLMLVARMTPGASGADLMNILNEAALLAARKGRRAVTAEEAIEATDKVRFGKERRSMQLDESEKRTTAFHESGHAVVGLCVSHSDPVEKVTIIPRGMSLGATHFLPKQNRVSYWRKELLDQLAVLMGGRVAEEQFVGDVCSGAQMDIAQATKLARAMVCQWGMTESLGLVAYDDNTSQDNIYLGGVPPEKNYSPETSKRIDAEVKKLIDEAYVLATDIIKKEQSKVELMAQMLMEFETLDKEDLDRIMEGTWNKEDKLAKLKENEEAHRKLPPPPPPKVDDDPVSHEDPSPQQI